MSSGVEPGADPQSSSETSKTIQVIQEFANLTKEVVETGKVRVIKSVTEETVSVNIPVVNESYEVKHVTVPYKILDEPPVPLIQQGDVTIIRVVREVSVVVKKYEIIEEIHVIKRLTQTPLTHEISLRKENVQVERVSND